MALEQGLALLTIVGILAGFVALLTSLYQLYRLMRLLDLGPEGNKFIATQMTIKFWASSVLGYFGAGSILAGSGGVPREWRQWINVFLAWFLVCQATWATVVYRRWRLGPRQRRVRKKGVVE